MEGIGFKNMKVFKDEHCFDFKNITLLTGTNNSGKSSVINAMQMLQENILKKDLGELLTTEFKVIRNQNKYGSIQSFINSENKNNEAPISFIRILEDIKYEFQLKIETGY